MFIRHFFFSKGDNAVTSLLLPFKSIYISYFVEESLFQKCMGYSLKGKQLLLEEPKLSFLS